MKTEESGSPLNREDEVVDIEEVEMVRCFNVATNSGLVYSVQYIPPYKRTYLKVSYPYSGGDVCEPLNGIIKEAVMEYIEREAKKT